MFRFYPGERFREIKIDYKLKFRYAVSDRGRLISFKEDFKDGTLLKGGDSKGYRTFRYHMTVNGRRTSRVFFVYKLVAELFIPRTSEDQKHVLHLDYQIRNDDISNLKWATYEEMILHRRKSPYIIKAQKDLLEHNIKSDGRKLTVTRVIHLKKLLQDPNRKTRLKMLAKQFGISEMQICRIKRGENWGHIKI
jgi:hypothetical protein